MKPPLPRPSPRAVNLKQSVPVSLQTVFGEEQWINAANLARQCYRSTKDPYYLAVEIAAKSQSDNVADRSAGKVAVENMIRDNTVLSDADALDLYEFSCSRLDIKYPETIGLLRLRLVKALPKDQISCTRCFEACVWNADWKNAQQIAASLNKNFINEPRILFRYILATHQYSLSDDCPEGSRKIFATLAKAQADKAFDLRVINAGKEPHLSRAALNESEAWLWLNIRITHCDSKDNIELFRKPEYSPLAFLEAGQHEPYWSAISYLATNRVWDDILRIGRDILERATRICQSEASAIEGDENVVNLRKLVDAEAHQSSSVKESSLKKDLLRAIERARPPRSSKDYLFIAASCEYGLLTAMFNAAKAQPDSKRALKQFGNLIDKVAKALNRAHCMKPIFQRTHSIMALAVVSARHSLADPGSTPSTTRVVRIANYIVQHYDSPQCLVEAMVFIKDLSQPELTVLLTSLRATSIKCADVFQGLVLMSLSFKIRYSVATSDGPMCRFCTTELEGDDCISCLKSIAANALDAYKLAMEDQNLRQKILSGQNVNPVSDIAVIGAICLLRLAGLGNLNTPNGTSSLYHTDMQLFLQAVLWLDSCMNASPARSNAHGIILAKLYLLMGCISRAKAIWDGFDVKNALLDSLGLLYIDRLTSMAPGLFILSSRGNPVQPFLTHFTKALKITTPTRIMDSLEVGTYSSVLEMIQHAGKQAASCSLVLTFVEERRGNRMKANRTEIHIDDQPLVRNLSIEHDLYDITDYESFTIAGGENSKTYLGDERTLQSILHYGPLPTGIRAHLGLLAERFLDLVCYVQPKEYKSSKAGQLMQLDWEYAHATSSYLERDMGIVLAITDSKLPEEAKAEMNRRREEVKLSLTSSELWYHSIVHGLANTVKTIISSGIMKAPTTETRDHIRLVIKQVLEALDDQTNDFLAVPGNFHSKIYAFHGFAALHAMGMLRETIIAVKQTVNYLLIASDKAKNVDKLRSSAELAWLTSELKKLATAAVESENTIKARIKLLRDYLVNVDGWRDRLCDWVFDDYATVYDAGKDFKKEICEKMKAAIPKAKAEVWADGIGESWRDLMKGWAAVRFE
ncbi:N-acetyltransferase B complex non catalytic subunit-domain-containing protein [Hypoxylon sp. FL0890]|nr:N-acetyltransferase B complex non catalytic subunit-domain-containing protein [Hypoxylon sp. FL0890]